MYQTETLAQFLHDLCRTSETGGRVREVAPSTCIVTDILNWTHDMTSRLEIRFNSARVDVERCTESLGGFAVRVRIAEFDAGHVIGVSITLAVMAVLIAFSLDMMPHFVYGTGRGSSS